MKISRLLMVILAVLLGLSACAKAATEVVPAGGTSEPTEKALPNAVVLAQQALAQQLGIDVSAVQVGSYEAKDWPDSCLGAGGPAEVCAAVITPGYEVTLQAGGASYVYRTDESGSVVRPAPTETGGDDAVVGSAKADLMGKLGISTADQIQVVSETEQEWPDACLGLAQPGEMCAMVITPGYQITLAVNGKEYVYRTDLSGTNVRAETGPEQAPQGDMAVEWQSAGETCQTATIGWDQTVTYGPCDGATASNPLGQVNAARPEQLDDLLARYQPFVAETAAGTLTFNGYGAAKATSGEQRSIAEWMRLTVDELVAGRGSAAAGLAIGWSRQGGIAGFCDDLGIYLDGYLALSSCKVTGSPSNVERLTAGQLEQLYQWVDNLKSFDVEQTDPATADAMTVKLVFEGAGAAEAGEAEKAAITSFAQDVWNANGVMADANGLAEAQATLVDFFDKLSAGDYAGAAQLYHGSLSTLIYYNPEIRPVDPAALFEAGCTINGFQCLKIKEVVSGEAQMSNRYHFVVRFANADGSQFSLGPCCGADPTSEPPVTEFEYTVRVVDGAYKVADLPPYTP